LSPMQSTQANETVNGVKIRTFRIADLARIMEIERQAFPDAWDENWFLYFYQTNPSGFFVATESKDFVIGYAIVDVESEAEHAWLFMEGKRLPPQRGHLLNIAIDKQWRKKGIGSKLLEKAADYVSERGVNILFLEVQTTNTNARTFYGNRGFKETGKVMTDYYPDGGDAIIMKKRLATGMRKKESKIEESGS
jgi:ribosomal-protein-alanine N-acetyltransferase